MSETVEEKLDAARESVEAHQEATGHERIDGVLVNHFPRVVVFSCTECGQQLARVSHP